MKHHLNPTRWVGIALLTLVTPATLSGLDLDPILIGESSPHPPGRARAVEVRDAHAYVAGESAGLWVIDVSRPDQPRQVAHLPTTGSVNQLFLQGDHVYLAQTDALAVVDVSDPANPRYIGSCPAWSQGNDVAVAGDYAYLADGENGLQIIRIADPTRPEPVATVPTGDSVSTLTVAGGYVYLCSGMELVTVRVSTPTEPEWMGAYSLSSHPSGLAVLGNHAFVRRFETLDIFALSNPASPALAYSYPGLGVHPPVTIQVQNVTAVDGRVFSSDNVLDVTDPLNPMRVSAIPGYSFAVVGDHVYTAAGESGLRIYHLGRPANPQRLGWVDFPGSALDAPPYVALAGDYAYTSTYHDSEPQSRGRLHVVNKSDPAVPRYLGTFERYAGGVTAMSTFEQHLYVAVAGSSAFGLHVYDLQDPTQPRRVGHCPLPDYPNRLQIANHHAYLLMRGKMDIIDVSDPTQPTKVGERIDEDITGSESSALAVEANRLYLAGRTTLKVFDMSDRGLPYLLGHYHYDWHEPTGANEISISNGYAYIATHFTLQVVAASDPSNLHWIGGISLPHKVYLPTVVISGHHAYVGCWQGSLLVFDIRDPSSPTLVGSNWSSTRLWRVAVDGGKLYAGGSVSSAALIVFDLYRPPLRLDPPESLGLDGWRLRLWGAPGQSLRLQRSPDLRTWEDCQTTIGTEQPQEFIDDTAGSRARQFYRAVSP